VPQPQYCEVDEEVVKDFDEEVEEVVVLLLTMGMARAELASAATMKENEARILLMCGNEV
jgi:hypothetical protein